MNEDDKPELSEQDKSLAKRWGKKLEKALKAQKDAETFSLRQSVFALENSLLPPATQETKLLEAIFAPEKPVSPKKGMILVLGFLGGLLMGIMWAFVSDAWRLAAERRRVV